MKKLALVFVLFVAACVTPQTPAQTVYLIHGDYAAALSLAVRYKQLPPCDEPSAPVLCRDTRVVAEVQRADDIAFAALQAAQNIVRTPGIDTSRTTLAITAAQNSVGAFVTIANRLKVN